MQNKQPTVIKSFPGAGVERHLRTHGHLPDYGCCEFDQPIDVGDVVSFAHENVHRKVTAIEGDMIEIEGMAGQFNMSIFRKINYKHE